MEQLNDSTLSTDTSSQPPKPDRFLRLACLVLGILAFFELMAVGIALTLKLSSPTTPARQNATTITTDNAPPHSSSTAKNTQPTISDELIEQIRPRTVEEMLREDSENQRQRSVPTFTPPPLQDLPTEQSSNAATGSDHSSDSRTATSTEGDVPLTPRLAQLLKEARYAQIEGDMRKSVLKLEEAATVEPGNPVLLYYFGLAYEALRNADKSREYFLKVYTMRDKAGKYGQLAAKHLETGFESPADRRGDMAFGAILQYRQDDPNSGQDVILTIPILMKEGLNIRPEDLYIPIFFYDSANGRKIELTRAAPPEIRWTTEPVDWADGEETLEVHYHMPPLTDEEIVAYGDLKYFGFSAKLYYKGEPMDCFASPRVLFIVEQMQMKKSGTSNQEEFYSEGLLPPLDAEQMSDNLPVEGL